MLIGNLKGIIKSLVENSTHSDDMGVYWADPEFDKTDDLHVIDDLYSGSPGIGLFLSYAYKYGNYLKVDGQFINTVFDSIIQRDTTTALGFYNGTVGSLYCLYHGSKNLNLFRNYRLWIYEKLKALNALDFRSFDMISGSAGCIPAFIHFYEEYEDVCYALLEKSIEHLITGVEVWASGKAYRALPADAHPLIGFSHGQTGIAYSLSILYNITKNESLRTLIHEILKFEDLFFNEETQNFPDLRSYLKYDDSLDLKNIDLRDAFKPHQRFMYAWCHGLPGVVLGRMHISKLIEDKSVAYDVNKLKLNHNSGSLCLCHGFCGNVEAIMDSKKNNFQNFQLSIDYNKSNKKELDFSLMTGLSGIGYQMLRSKHKEIPSILAVPNAKNTSNIRNKITKLVSKIVQDKKKHFTYGGVTCLSNPLTKDYIEYLIRYIGGSESKHNKEIALKTLNSFTDVQEYHKAKSELCLNKIAQLTEEHWLMSIDSSNIKLVRSFNHFITTENNENYIILFHGNEIYRHSTHPLYEDLLLSKDINSWVKDFLVNNDKKYHPILQEQILVMIKQRILVHE